MAEQPLGWRERIAAVAKGRVAVSVDEAAILLGIGRALAYREALKGSLPTFRVGRRLLVGVATLERLLGGE